MSFMKIFKLAQKGSKKVKRSKSSAATAAKWPDGVKVGVFGHENSGKTVFFTALYMKSKATKDISISVRDSATGNEFFMNEMAIKGVHVDRAGEGTIAAKAVPRKFPDPTEKGIVLQFTAILGGGKKIPVVTYDYSGKAATLSEHSDEAQAARDFMANADGLFFFFDPKILGADPEVQADDVLGHLDGQRAEDEDEERDDEKQGDAGCGGGLRGQPGPPEGDERGRDKEHDPADLRVAVVRVHGNPPSGTGIL